MTKANMITTIQKKEAALWLELAEYDSIYAPVDVDVDGVIDWEVTDPGHCERARAWAAVKELMEEMGIEFDFNLPDQKAAFHLRDDLYDRRHAARGHYC